MSRDADKDVYGGRLIRKLILMDGPIGGGNNKDVKIARMQSFCF